MQFFFPFSFFLSFLPPPTSVLQFAQLLSLLQFIPFPFLLSAFFLSFVISSLQQFPLGLFVQLLFPFLYIFFLSFSFFFSSLSSCSELSSFTPSPIFSFPPSLLMFSFRLSLPTFLPLLSLLFLSMPLLDISS